VLITTPPALIGKKINMRIEPKRLKSIAHKIITPQ
jgi:hypothetical protein